MGTMALFSAIAGAIAMVPTYVYFADAIGLAIAVCLYYLAGTIYYVVINRLCIDKEVDTGGSTE